MQIFQVTISAVGKTQFPQLDFEPQVMTVQANGANPMRVGDVSVTTTRGIALTGGGGSFTFSLGQDYSTRTSEWWVAGTAADVLDVMVL